MTIQNKTALLVGASGLVGQELLMLLLNSSNYRKVTIFVRRQLNIQHPKLEQIIVNYDQLEAYEEHVQVDEVYCCLGTTIKAAGSQAAFRKVDFEYPVRVARLAQKSGVKRFLIITALGANANSSLFYSRVKGEVEEAIKQAGIRSVHIFQPSLLLGKRNHFRLGEKIASFVSPLLSLVMLGRLRKYKPIKAEAVARAMVVISQRELRGSFTYPSDQILALNKQEL